jgi:hypothetical protein
MIRGAPRERGRQIGAQHLILLREGETGGRGGKQGRVSEGGGSSTSCSGCLAPRKRWRTRSRHSTKRGSTQTKACLQTCISKTGPPRRASWQQRTGPRPRQGSTRSASFCTEKSCRVLPLVLPFAWSNPEVLCCGRISAKGLGDSTWNHHFCRLDAVGGPEPPPRRAQFVQKKPDSFAVI